MCLFGRAAGRVLRSHEQCRCDDRMVGGDAHVMCDIRWSDGIKRTRRYNDTWNAVVPFLQATLECANHGSVEDDFIRSHHRRHWKTASIDGNGMRKMMMRQLNAFLMRCRLIGFGVPSSCAHSDT